MLRGTGKKDAIVNVCLDFWIGIHGCCRQKSEKNRTAEQQERRASLYYLDPAVAGLARVKPRLW